VDGWTSSDSFYKKYIYVVNSDRLFNLSFLSFSLSLFLSFVFFVWGLRFATPTDTPPDFCDVYNSQLHCMICRHHVHFYAHKNTYPQSTVQTIHTTQQRGNTGCANFFLPTHTITIDFATMAPLRTLAALILGAGAASAFAPTTPLATRTVAPVVRYALICNE